MFCNHCGQVLPASGAVCPACNTPTPRVDVGPIDVVPDIAQRAQDFEGRGWVTLQVLQWAYQGNTRYFFLTGEPGSGKTALAAWLAGAGPAPSNADEAQRLSRARGLWDAAHFCIAPNQAGSLDPVNFARHLAQQLSARYPAFAEGILLTHDPRFVITQEIRENLGQAVAVQINNFIVNASNAQDTYNRLVREPLKFLMERHPGMRVFILADAMDEALAFTPPDIVTLLAGSGDLVTWSLSLATN